MRFLGFVGMLVLLFSQALANDHLSLKFPLDCKLGADCWVAKYFDHDPTPDVKDFGCGKLADDGHTGTDFAVRDVRAMEKGVDVFAAASGKVLAIREGMDDVSSRLIDKESIKGKGCGNGVLLDHGDGWKTQYCHMKKESITVKPGEDVAVGQILGKLGMSGNAEFPHLEFLLRHNDKKLDPFMPASGTCGSVGKGLWDSSVTQKLLYQPVAMYNAGFADKTLTQIAARSGDFHQGVMKSDAPAIIFWVEVFGVVPSDNLNIRIVDPMGIDVVNQTFQPKKRFIYQYAGKRNTGKWMPGVYQGTATLTRGGRRFVIDRTVSVVAE